MASLMYECAARFVIVPDSPMHHVMPDHAENTIGLIGGCAVTAR